MAETELVSGNPAVLDAVISVDRWFCALIFRTSLPLVTY